MNSADERRDRLVDLREMVERYERSGEAIMHDRRYDLSVRATDLNGDGCRFPACGCARADCAQRPAVEPVAEWMR